MERAMIRAAIVGLGWWGKTLLEAAAESAHIRFTVAVSRHPTAAIEGMATDHGLRLLHTLRRRPCRQ
jgi:predicted dehydrogenase